MFVSRYAAQSALVQFIKECMQAGVSENTIRGIRYAAEELNEVPAADVVEVVRCGNCIYFHEPFCTRRDDETHRERINMLSVDFCSYGRRRD